jgi:outer membrane protein TolC
MACGHRKADAGRADPPLAPHGAGDQGVLNWLARQVLVGLLAISCSALVSCATERPPAQNGHDLPERLRTQVAPEPTATWRAPDLRGYSSALKPTEKVPIDPARQYDLLELIDVAERANPETRIAWERARQAAIGVGLVESEYFPMLSLSAFGGYQSLALPAPQTLIPEGFFRVEVAHFVPGLNLKWLLLDFGRRGTTMDAAKERLLAANLGFNRSHQALAFRVQRAFYALTSVRARIAVAQAALDAARAVQGAAESRFANGLETVPNVLLARQQTVQAEFELVEFTARERDAQVTLAQSMGILPTTPLQLVDFAALHLPPTLEDSVEQVIDRALEQRPDLIAKVALVREKEAEVRRARADYFPTLSVGGDVGGELARTRYDVGGTSTSWFNTGQPTYGGGLRLEWQLFEGGARERKVELAEAARRAAEQEVTAARDQAISEIWKAYTDVRLGFRRLDVASALVKASESSYEAVLRSYRLELGTLVDLLAARREISRARFQQVETKLQLLDAAVTLAFSTGEVPPSPSRGSDR